MSSDIKLLPCPFCNGEVKYYRPSHHIEHFVNKHTVYCEHCDYRMEGVSALQLMKRWNTRKPMDRIVEQLEEESEVSYKDWQRFDEESSFGAMNAYSRAIEIVKAGGK